MINATQKSLTLVTNEQGQPNGFLFDLQAIKADFESIPGWKIELLRSYGCAELWVADTKNTCHLSAVKTPHRGV